MEDDALVAERLQQEEAEAAAAGDMAMDPDFAQ